MSARGRKPKPERTPKPMRNPKPVRMSKPVQKSRPMTGSMTVGNPKTGRKPSPRLKLTHARTSIQRQKSKRVWKSNPPWKSKQKQVRKKPRLMGAQTSTTHQATRYVKVVSSNSVWTVGSSPPFPEPCYECCCTRPWIKSDRRPGIPPSDRFVLRRRSLRRMDVSSTLGERYATVSITLYFDPSNHLNTCENVCKGQKYLCLPRELSTFPPHGLFERHCSSLCLAVARPSAQMHERPWMVQAPHLP